MKMGYNYKQLMK